MSDQKGGPAVPEVQGAPISEPPEQSPGRYRISDAGVLELTMDLTKVPLPLARGILLEVGDMVVLWTADYRQKQARQQSRIHRVSGFTDDIKNKFRKVFH